jgi:hypothetical protein
MELNDGVVSIIVKFDHFILKRIRRRSILLAGVGTGDDARGNAGASRRVGGSLGAAFNSTSQGTGRE